MRDSSAAPLYIGSRAAADFAHPDFRAWWIAQARGRGWPPVTRGLFIDDAFMERRTTTAGGASARPLDPRTGATMTEADWQRYMADFLVAGAAPPRSAPDVEIVHDVLWYKGDANAHVLRELQAASFVSVDKGFNDATVSYGAGTYGFSTLAGWIEREQSRAAATSWTSRRPRYRRGQFALASQLARQQRRVRDRQRRLHRTQRILAGPQRGSRNSQHGTSANTGVAPQ